MSENPCIGCSTDQRCCSRLEGLRVSADEYERNFRAHERDIEVRRHAGLYIVSSQEGRPCPNWSDDHCIVYDTRSMECRLYPFTIGRVTRRGDRVSILFHSDTHCPRQRALRMKRADAESMIRAFARSAFPDAREVDVRIVPAFVVRAARLPKRLLRLGAAQSPGGIS